MKPKAALLLMLTLASAALPAAAQSQSRYDLSPGALVNLVMRLYRPVSVDLRDASLGQAASMIADASNVPIHVDGRVPATRVSLSARDVPLGVVLEQLAQQANVLIAPESSTNGWLNRIDQSLRLVPAPALQPEAGAAVAAPYAPWSDAWGLNPVAGAFTSAAAMPPPQGGNGGRF